MTQVCSKCNIEKEISMFHKRKDVKTGYRKDCKECHHKQTVNTRDKTEKSLYDNIWYRENKERRKQLATKWQKNNSTKWNAYVTSREAEKIKAIPKWLDKEDLEVIEWVYETARERTNKYGIKFEVDHIIPLRGKNVCGFHCIENLQVITAYENRCKSNKY